MYSITDDSLAGIEQRLRAEPAHPRDADEPDIEPDEEVRATLLPAATFPMNGAYGPVVWDCLQS